MQRPNDCEYTGMVECDPSTRNCNLCGWNPDIKQKRLRQVERNHMVPMEEGACKSKAKSNVRQRRLSRNRVYVLSRRWDTLDNEGSEIIGVYRDAEKAIADMKADAAITKAEYPADFWEDDFTWEDDFEIHLGCGSTSICDPATVYGWEIEKVEVR